MGWWSTAVLGGDGPCDLQCTLRNMIGLEGLFSDRLESSGSPSEEDIAKARSIFQNCEFMERVTDMIEKEEYDDVKIGYQVLGVMMMEFGVPMSIEMKVRITKAAQDDEWAREDGEREASMKSFIEDLEKYNGEPTQLSAPDPGLLSVINKHLMEGKKGLVNK